MRRDNGLYEGTQSRPVCARSVRGTEEDFVLSCSSNRQKILYTVAGTSPGVDGLPGSEGHGTQLVCVSMLVGIPHIAGRFILLCHVELRFGVQIQIIPNQMYLIRRNEYICT